MTFLDQANYMKEGNTPSEGVRAAVITPNVSILTDEYGMDIYPNTKTTVALRNQKITRMPAPYTTNCTPSWAETDYSDFNQTTYTLLVSHIGVPIERFWRSTYFTLNP